MPFSQMEMMWENFFLKKDYLEAKQTWIFEMPLGTQVKMHAHSWTLSLLEKRLGKIFIFCGFSNLVAT